MDSSLLSTRIYNGGPVESIGLLHDISSLQGEQATPRMKFTDGVSFYHWRNQIQSSLITQHAFRFFLGECTWSAGQLMDEVRQGCWILCEADANELDLLNGDDPVD